jgi:hypothetical protein
VNISNKPAPRIKLITKQVKMKPGFIGLSIDDSSKGCHAKRKIFKTP